MGASTLATATSASRTRSIVEPKGKRKPRDSIIGIDSSVTAVSPANSSVASPGTAAGRASASGAISASASRDGCQRHTIAA